MDHPTAHYERILLPLDTEAPSSRALEEAIAIARLSGARLCLMSVFDECRHVSGFEPAPSVIGVFVGKPAHPPKAAPGKAFRGDAALPRGMFSTNPVDSGVHMV